MKELKAKLENLEMEKKTKSEAMLDESVSYDQIEESNENYSKLLHDLKRMETKIEDKEISNQELDHQISSMKAENSNL